MKSIEISIYNYQRLQKNCQTVLKTGRQKLEVCSIYCQPSSNLQHPPPPPSSGWYSVMFLVERCDCNRKDIHTYPHTYIHTTELRSIVKEWRCQISTMFDMSLPANVHQVNDVSCIKVNQTMAEFTMKGSDTFLCPLLLLYSKPGILYILSPPFDDLAINNLIHDSHYTVVRNT